MRDPLPNLPAESLTTARQTCFAKLEAYKFKIVGEIGVTSERYPILRLDETGIGIINKHQIFFFAWSKKHVHLARVSSRLLDSDTLKLKFHIWFMLSYLNLLQGDQSCLYDHQYVSCACSEGLPIANLSLDTYHVF